MRFRKMAVTTLGLVAAASLVACGPDTGGEGSGVSVSHTTTKQAISENTQQMGATMTTSLQFLEHSALIEEGLAFAPQDDVACAVPLDENGDPVEGYECPSEPQEEVTVDTNFDEETQQVVDYLDQYVFADANIESESGKSVTYLLKGSVVCDALSGASTSGCSGVDENGDPVSCDTTTTESGPDPECVQQVDDAEIRLYVTSPQAGDIDIDVFVGPQRHNPGRVEFHSDTLAAEADLAGIKGAINHIASVSGESAPDLPATMQGRVRGELIADSQDKMTAAIHVLSAIKVADGDYSVSVGATQPALKVTADAAAQTIDAMMNLGAVDAKFPVNETTYVSTQNPDGTYTDVEETTSYDVAFHLDGASSQSLFEAAQEALTVNDISLGDDTSTVDIDGKRVLEVDLNKDHGRSYSATISQDSNGDVNLEVSPAFDLRVMMKFVEVADKFDDMADWMLDDVLRVTLDGATKPKLRIDGTNEQVEVVEGELTLSLQNAAVTHTVSANQCLVDKDTTTDTSNSGDVVDATNPLDEVEVASCQ